MAKLVVNLPQKEYQTFERKVDILRKRGVSLDYDVAGRNKRSVKITMRTPVEAEKWDALCEGVN